MDITNHSRLSLRERNGSSRPRSNNLTCTLISVLFAERTTTLCTIELHQVIAVHRSIENPLIAQPMNSHTGIDVEKPATRIVTA